MGECERASQLSAYHDSEMPPTSRGEFEQHLRQCALCAAELERLRKLTDLFGSLPPPAVPPGMLSRLHRVVDLSPAAVVRRITGVLASVAAAVLVACLVGLAKQPSSQPASEAMPVWESRVLNHQAEESAFGSTEELLARWMAQDLSGKERL